MLRNPNQEGVAALPPGFFIVKAFRTNPVLDLAPAHGAAIGHPARARGDQAPMAVVPRPFLK